MEKKRGRPTIYTDELALKICKRIADGESESLVYSLSDESGVRYIGQTKFPQRRFHQHCSLSNNRGGTEVNKWLYKIIQKGEKPIIGIIEFTDNLYEREIYWIDYYKKNGVVLLNMTNGGFDYPFLRKKKLEKPWGQTLSPVQFRLRMIRYGINFNKRIGNTIMAEYFEMRYKEISDIIKKVGLLEMNNLLWLKYEK